VEKLSQEDALEYISQGKYRLASGAGMGPVREQPFFNPYMLGDPIELEDL
jgi:hypothetical protein